MRRLETIFLVLTLLFSTGCGKGAGEVQRNVLSNNENTEIVSEDNTMESKENDTLVAYFSATGTTEKVAEYAADILHADIYEIVPEVPYTDEDLAYYTGGRADREQDDSSARPAISSSFENMEQYDTILLGYPKMEQGYICV